MRFTSSHVLEHIPDPCVWAAAVYSVLKPGGVVFTEVPNQLKPAYQNMRSGVFHLTYWSRDAFRRFMIAQGFEALPLKGKDRPSMVRTVFRKPR